jgi:hypothetical protein
VYKYHIFLIHLSVVGHLGSFHNLAIVNSAAINMGMQGLCIPCKAYPCRCKLTHIPSGISLGMVLLDHMEDLILVF